MLRKKEGNQAHSSLVSVLGWLLVQAGILACTERSGQPELGTKRQLFGGLGRHNPVLFLDYEGLQYVL